jgi:hypothetical protein
LASIHNINTYRINRKSGTAVVTAWTFFYGLFYIDYGPHEHVLSDIQRWYRRQLDRLLGIDARAVKQISDRENIADNNDTTNINIGLSKGEVESIVTTSGKEDTKR